MTTVYVLWFEQEWKDCDDCELLIGVYSSESEAQAAIERVVRGLDECCGIHAQSGSSGSRLLRTISILVPTRHGDGPESSVYAHGECDEHHLRI
jgi:hypothetical protein